jgi:hypothetical protein
MRLVAEKNKACTKIIEGITTLLTCSAVSLLELRSGTQRNIQMQSAKLV